MSHLKYKQEAQNEEQEPDHSRRGSTSYQQEFLSEQEKKGFMPDNEMVLMGELKPKFFR